jgi:hypothetical protein
LITLPLETRTILLILCGIFSAVLGLTHIVYPQLFRYRSLIFNESNLNRKLEPFRLWPIVYPLNLRNLYGIVWMMNFHVSFVMISMGASGWLLTEARYLIVWFAAWWLLRAACQVMLGRYWYDWLILSGFAVLGIIHLWLGLG